MKYPAILATCWIFVSLSPAMAAPCPASTSAWEQWLEDTSTSLVKSAERSYRAPDPYIEPFNKEVTRIQKFLARCPAPKEGELKEKMERFTGYLQQVGYMTQPGHGLGFSVPDHQYFEETKHFTDLPDYLKNPKFLQWVSGRSTLPQAKAYLDKINRARPADKKLIYFSYSSRHLESADSAETYGRLLVVDPLTDQWVQFGVPDGNKRAENISVIAIQRHADGTHTPYYKDHFRVYEGNSRKVVGLTPRYQTKSIQDYPLENCTICHKMGAASIFPDEGSVPESELANVRKVNDLIKTYGPVTYGKYLDTSKLGPGLGNASLFNGGRRTASNVPGWNQDTVGKAMNCAGCHYGEKIGEIHWPFNQIQIESFIDSGSMPVGLGDKMSAKELKELRKTLLAEYFGSSKERPGILKSWLLSLTSDQPLQSLRAELLSQRCLEKNLEGFK